MPLYTIPTIREQYQDNLIRLRDNLSNELGVAMMKHEVSKGLPLIRITIL